ncbi:hypothetical protein ACWDTI_02740 [Gordonia sp. NPDC003424]
MNEIRIGPRSVVFPAGGKLKQCTIDPGQYVASRLVSELADAWRECAELVDLTPGTISRQASVVRSVGKYLTAETDRFLTLSGDGAEVVRRLHDWESAMVAKFPPPSVRAKDLGMELRNQVARHLQSNGVAGGALTDWANSLVLDGRPSQEVPLDEFNNHERLQLEQTCRQVVRDTESRLARGEDLLRAGRDPRRDGWDRIENVLWALRYLPYDDAFHVHLVGRRRLIDPRDVDRLAGVRRADKRIKAPPILSAVGAFLIPEPEYLLAIRVLLHLQTGWSPEESGRLQRADIEYGAESVRVRATKLRAQRVRWHTLPSSADQSWGWKAGDLLRRATFAMRHAHDLTPKATLFWTTAVHSARDREEHEYPHYLVREHHFGRDNSLRKLVERHELSISEPHDMRRLRKTVKSARAAVLGTLAGAAGDDQTTEVFREHYAQTTTVHTLAAQTILRAQRKVLNNVAVGPTLVVSSAAEAARSAIDSELAEVAGTVAAETSTEQELTIAACRDPHDAPFLETGILCHASPSMCLQCRNAIIFRDHLPRLIAYREALDSIEKNTPPAVFSELYGQQRVNIDNVVAEFTTEEVEAARQLDVRVHRPLGQRTEHE